MMEFRRRKAQSLELGPVYIHEQVVPEMSSGPYDRGLGPETVESPFKITASRAGLRLEGKLNLFGPGELREFAKVISDAQRDADKLKPKLSSNLAGH